MKNDLIFLEIIIPFKNETQFQQEGKMLYEWRERQKDHIKLFGKPTFSVKQENEQKIFLAKVKEFCLSDFPPKLKKQKLKNMSPVKGIIANIRNQLIETDKGKKVWGCKHFLPNEQVYPHSSFSGDGYERARITGKHRESGKFITIMMPTIRCDNWRIDWIKNPFVIYQFRKEGMWQWAGSLEDMNILVNTMDFRLKELANKSLKNI
ncbi:hypothetical protein [Nostoc sp.]|uniref:hypothetical protein n=1 Tax=Nostoc sp. TaxID=1180 RepID=UPI002FF22E68